MAMNTIIVDDKRPRDSTAPVKACALRGGLEAAFNAEDAEKRRVHGDSLPILRGLLFRIPRGAARSCLTKVRGGGEEGLQGLKPSLSSPECRS